MLERYGRLPTDVVACVGGGSNAMGIFAGFVDDPAVKLWGVEASGHGIACDRYGGLDQRRDGRHLARFAFVRAADGRGASARHAFDQRRPRLSRRRTGARVPQAIPAVRRTCRRRMKRRWPPITRWRAREGIVPALESAHAIAYACKLARERGPDGLILVNLSGRGDKDTRTVAALDAAAPASGAGMIAAGDRLAGDVRARARRAAGRVDHLPRRRAIRTRRRRRAVIDAISPMRRPDRIGHPLRRPAGRRSDDRRRRSARARERHDARRRASARPRRARARCRPDPVLHLREPDRPIRRGAFRRRRRAPPARSARSCPTCRSKNSIRSRRAFRAEELAIPLLVAPTTPPERAVRIAAESDGFV